MSGAPQYDLLAIGECMVELSASTALGHASSLRRSYGGDVLNSLVAAARLGARTGFISRVGDDPFGAAMLQSWRAEGIDTRGAPLEPGENGVYFISVDADGEREFSYRRAGSPASRLAPGDLDSAQIAASRWLLLSGITQALSDSACAATLEAAKIARKHGVSIAYDPNYRPRLWLERGGEDAARAAFREVAALADWILPSHPADMLLCGAEANDTPAATARRFSMFTEQVAPNRWPRWSTAPAPAMPGTAPSCANWRAAFHRNARPGKPTRWRRERCSIGARSRRNPPL